MKKLLSILLVLLMVTALFACTKTPAPEPAAETTPAPEPAPEPEPEPAVTYEGIALQIKNKTGVTIDEMYIYPAGGEMGNSVVEKGWPDKDADPEGYEKFIYIVREPGKDMEVTVVFENGEKAVWAVGPLKTYEELSLKKGTDVANWEHEVLDKDEDKAMCDIVAALGKTADNFYPGYVLIPVELKNKTGKGIVELYFYEEGGDPKAYNNVIDYLYAPTGEKMEVLMSGKAKEGGMYLFKCFIRPLADNYMIDVVFDDGTSITYPIEGWFKPDGSGNLPNEISLKNAEDPDDIKVQYDDGVPEPIDYLAESLAKGYVVDQWYPSYTTIELDEATLAPFKAGLAAIPVPAPEEPAEPAEPTEPAEPIVGDDPSTWAPVFVPAEGYVQLALQLKNKTGKDIKELYIYPVGEEIGNNVTVEPLPDKKTDGEGYERFILLFREEAKLGAMEVKVVYADGEEAVWKLTDELKSYDKLSMDGGTQPDAEGAEWKHKASKEEDYPEFEAVINANIAADDFYPVVKAGYEIPEGFVGIALQLKNKTGKDMAELYIYAQGEEIGQNLLSGNPLPDKKTNGDAYERFVYIIREAAKLGAMEIKVVYGDGEEAVWKLTDELKSYDKLSMDGGTQPDAEGAEWKHKASKEEDYPEFEAVIAAAIPDDGWYPEA